MVWEATGSCLPLPYKAHGRYDFNPSIQEAKVRGSLLVLGQSGLQSLSGLTGLLQKIKTKNRTGKMAQWVKECTAKLDYLSLIPGTHMAEGESPLP